MEVVELAPEPSGIAALAAAAGADAARESRSRRRDGGAEMPILALAPVLEEASGRDDGEE